MVDFWRFEVDAQISNCPYAPIFGRIFTNSSLTNAQEPGASGNVLESWLRPFAQEKPFTKDGRDFFFGTEEVVNLLHSEPQKSDFSFRGSKRLPRAKCHNWRSNLFSILRSRYGV